MIVQEMRDLKQAGYSLNEVMDHLAARPGKTPYRATVRKCYDERMRRRFSLIIG